MCAYVNAFVTIFLHSGVYTQHRFHVCTSVFSLQTTTHYSVKGNLAKTVLGIALLKNKLKIK